MVRPGVRITGGVYRSRRLLAPPGNATRPTSDRVREALFSILAAEGDISGALVLDLYAGTGALALEALSRGAAHATLVERDRSALGAIARNIEALGVGASARVVASPVERALRTLAGSPPFDFVFADPPYALVASGETSRALERAVTARLIAPKTRVVLEHASADAPPQIGALVLDVSRRYGDTTLSLYRLLKSGGGGLP